MGSINYAEQYSPELFEIVMQNALTSPFITTNVTWLNAKTFHMPILKVSGLGNHSRNGGYNKGNVSLEYKTYTIEHDRDISFLIDKADVDETNQVLKLENISKQLQMTQYTPEFDARFFSRVCKYAKDAKLTSDTAISTYTKKNVYSKLKDMMNHGSLKLYRQHGSLVGFVRSEIMDMLELAEDFSRQIEVATISEGGVGIETRITKINGVTLFEVIDDDRFWNAFNFGDDGYSLIKKVSSDPGPVVEGSKKINVMFVSLETVKTVPKINSLYMFEPGSHTEGDGYLYQNRQMWDTFVFPNGKSGEIDSIFVDLDTTEYTEE